MGRRRKVRRNVLEEISRKVLYGGLCGYGEHRIGTYEIESALVEHERVAEAAVVSVPDEIKGEVPVAFVVLKEGVERYKGLEEELKKVVPKAVLIVDKLPKTRSGKIMRRLLRAI